MSRGWWQRDESQLSAHDCHQDVESPEFVGGPSHEAGVRAHPIGRPRRAEIPFELPSHLALAFGNTVLEIGGGASGRGIAMASVAAGLATDRARPFFAPTITRP